MKPFWQVDPCPAFCRVEHEDHECFDDRFHRPQRELAEIALTLEDPVHHERTDGHLVHTPPVLRVDVEQHYREAEARVLVTVNDTCGVRLSLDEAETIGRALIDALKSARGEA